MRGAENNHKSQDLAISIRPPQPRQARRQQTPTQLTAPVAPAPVQLLLQTPGSLSADTALGCLGGNSRSLNEVQAVKGTVGSAIDRLRRPDGKSPGCHSYPGSTSHASLPHLLLENQLCSWEVATPVFNRACFLSGVLASTDETKKYKAPSILTVLQKRRTMWRPRQRHVLLWVCVIPRFHPGRN